MMHEAKGIVQDRLSRGHAGNNSGNTSNSNSLNSNGLNSNSANRQRNDGSTAMKVPAQFCPVDQDPFDTVSWEKRTAQIKDESGDVLFEQTDCEIPESWSALATNVVVSKYFYGEPGTAEREQSARQLIHRVARTIADWGTGDGYFATREDGENFYRDLSWLCLHQYGSFNSPVWFNVGLYHEYGIKGSRGNYYWDVKQGKIDRPETPYEYPQASACFIQSVEDNMEDIMRLATSEAMLFKYGSGTGTDLSTIRSAREKLSGGGIPSGPLSFMRVYDQIAAVVKSGGKTRRAAKMQSLKDWHPDVLEFIQAKRKEERKARTLIESGEYDSNFNGEAYSSIMFQNANLSVRVSDEFMNAAVDGKKWKTHWVTDPKHAGPEHDAKYLLRQIADGTWYCGDPGVQYETTINRWHTCSNTGPINASNPCSEYMFLDDTACNLSSLNLKKFQEADGRLNVERFRAAAAIFITAQEILVDHASYPTPAIAENSHRFRPLGLGYANLGSLLMSMGIPYDSDEGRGIAGSLTALLNGQGFLTSSRISAHLGPFAGYDENERPMLRVMQMHRDAVDEIDPSCPEYLSEAAREVWDECLASGRRHGYRNAQATVLAPTGTIAFMMDCDTTGIEPDIALVKYKQLAGGGMMKIINRTVPKSLATLGYEPAEIEAIVKYIDEHDTIEGAPELRDEHLAVFDCAFKPKNGKRSIAWQAPRQDDGGRPAVPLRCDFQNGQHARGVDRRGHRERLPRRLAARPQGAGHLSRRLEEEPAAQHQQGSRQQERRGIPADAPPSAGHPPIADAQVLRRRTRGLHHRRPVRGRSARRAVHHHGQGRQHHRRPDGHHRHRNLARPAVRRASAGVCRQVLPHAVRAVRLDHQPGDSARQERGRLHLPLARHPIHPRLPRSQHAQTRTGGRSGIQVGP